MAAHSVIGASSAYRWMACPGSVKLSEGIVNRSSPYALRGTAAHQLAEYCMADTLDAASFRGASVVVQQDGSTIEVEVTEEMIAAVQVYLDFIRAPRDGEIAAQTLVEHRFQLSDLHPDLFGTSDCVQWFPQAQVLRVTDYKNGVGFVDVVENPQGLFYALGALRSLRFPARNVEIAIVQPNCPGVPAVRTWTLDAVGLLDWQADLMQAVARVDEARKHGAEGYLKAGDHCHYCPAAGVPGRCAVIEAQQYAVVNAEFAPLLAYDPQKLADTLALLPAVEARIKQIREFAYAEAEAGRVAPGWKLVDKRASRRWRDEEQARAGFEMLGVEVTETKLRSPAQVEKLLTKEQRALLERLTIKESSGHVLAPADDPREPVRRTAQEVFADLPPM